MYLRTLGKFELEGSNLTGVKPLLLLTYLAIAGEPQSKNDLADLFWIKNHSSKSKRDLRLDSLRKATKKLQDYGLSIHDELYSTNLQCDVLELQACIKHSLVDKAIELYRGSFLEGIKLENLKVTEDAILWIESVRVSSAHQLRRLLIKEAQSQLVEDKHGKAEPYAVKGWELIKLYGLDVTESNEDLETITKIFTALNHDLRFEVEEERSMYSDDALFADPEQAKDSLKENNVKVEKKTNLFAPTFRFVGRAKDCVLINDLLLDGNHRLITLHGYGGVGKSRLAQEICFQQLKTQNFVDGIFSISLQDVEDRDEIVLRIARVFDENLEEGTMDNLVAKIRGKNSLLILDNYDYLVDKAYDIPAIILKHCSEMSILVTSREVLNIEEETIYPLTGMDIPEKAPNISEVGKYDYLKLFEARAQKSDAKFTFKENNIRTIHKISRILDGNPLGVILAASCVFQNELKTIEHRLSEKLNNIESPFRNTNDKHKNLETVFLFSWQTLSSEQQNALKRLAIFVNCFTISAFEYVSGSDNNTFLSLLSKSLIQRLDLEHYTFHPLIKDFCLKLIQQEEFEEIGKKYSDFYYLEANRWRQRLVADDKKTLVNFMSEMGNYVYAGNILVKKQDVSKLSTVCLVLAQYCSISGKLIIGVETIIDEAFELICELKHSVLSIVNIYQAMATVSFLNDNSRLAIMHLENAYRILSKTKIFHEPNNEKVASILGDLGVNFINLGKFEDAYEIFKIQYKIKSYDESSLSFGSCCHHLGYLAIVLGEYQQANYYIQKGMDLDELYSNTIGLAAGYFNIGNLQYEQGYFKQAEENFRKSLKIAQELNVPYIIEEDLFKLIQIKIEKQQPAAVRYLYKELKLLNLANHNASLKNKLAIVEAHIALQKTNNKQAIYKLEEIMVVNNVEQESDGGEDVKLLLSSLYIANKEFARANDILNSMLNFKLWGKKAREFKELKANLYLSQSNSMKGKA